MILYKSILTIVIVGFSISGSWDHVSENINRTPPPVADYFGCTPFNDKAERTVKFFLQHDSESMQSFRAETGTEGIPLSEIQHVNSSIECSQLDALVAGNSDYQHEETDFTRYYYKTNDFYYIFYGSNKARLGYTKFMVVRSDYKVKGLYRI